MTITEKNVTFQSGDELNEDNLRKLLRILTQHDGNGFIHRGLTVTADHVNDNIDVEEGAAVITDDTGEGAYAIEHPGLTGASVANQSGMNYIFLTIDPTVDNDVTVEINSSDAPDRTPALKIAEVDTLNDQPAEMFNVEKSESFDDLTATGSFTDPAGVVHTGELAEAGDPPTAHDHAGESLGSSSPVTSVNSESVTTGRVNDIICPEPGELQAAIDEADTNGGSVQLLEDETYAPGDTITLHRGVDLYFNGAKLDVTGDYHGILCGGFNRIQDMDVVVQDGVTYTSAALILKTDVYGKYGNHTRTSVKANGRLEGNDSGGQGLHLYDGAIDKANGIGLGNRFVLDIKRFTDGILAEGTQTTSWVNGPEFNVHIANCENAIHQMGRDDFPFRTDIYGVIQTGDSTNNVLWNEANSVKSFDFYGAMWDVPQHVDGSTTFAVAGKGISYIGRHALEVKEYCDGASNQYIEGRRGLNKYIADPMNGNDWEIDMNDGDFIFKEGGSDILRIRQNGRIRAIGKGKWIFGAEDLTQRSPISQEVARHDGSNGPAASLCFADGTSWYHIKSGTTF